MQSRDSAACARQADQVTVAMRGYYLQFLDFHVVHCVEQLNGAKDVLYAAKGMTVKELTGQFLLLGLAPSGQARASRSFSRGRPTRGSALFGLGFSAETSCGQKALEMTR